MNLLGDAAETPRLKRFRLLIPWHESDVHLHLSAEPLRKNLPHDAICRTQFLEACEDAQRAGHSYLRAHTRPSADTAVIQSRTRTNSDSEVSASQSLVSVIYFNLCKVAPLWKRTHSMFSLSHRLKTMSLAKRIELAFRVTESGLLLFGTSWLSFLNSRTLHRIEISGQTPQYVLDIKQRINVLRNKLAREG